MSVEYRCTRRLKRVAIGLQEDPIVVPGFRGGKNLALPLPEGRAGRGMGRKPPSRAAMNPVQPSPVFGLARRGWPKSCRPQAEEAGRAAGDDHFMVRRSPYWIRIISRVVACGGGDSRRQVRPAVAPKRTPFDNVPEEYVGR